MKGSESFKQAIEAHLQKVAEKDEAFAKKLKKEHDRLMVKKQLRIAKRNEESRKKKALNDQRIFKKHIARFKGLKFLNNSIEVVVLESVDAFLEESETLKHCLFTNEYYSRTESLILSARIDGQPIETIEVSLNNFKVLQSRGLHNNHTDHHEQIVKLVNQNIDKIRNAARRETKVKSLKKRDYVEAV